MTQMRAPWTQDQVAALNAWQQGPVHPFACGNCRADLVATTDGWTCPQEGCGYTQAWAHDFMADPETLTGIYSWNPGWTRTANPKPPAGPGMVHTCVTPPSMSCNACMETYTSDDDDITEPPE